MIRYIGGGVSFIAALFIILFFLFGLAAIADKFGCEAKWADSGRKHDWSFLAGCRVEDSQGRLIPEKNIRDIQ